MLRDFYVLSLANKNPIGYRQAIPEYGFPKNHEFLLIGKLSVVIAAGMQRYMGIGYVMTQLGSVS
jgi:hypothetical protein